LETTFFPNTRRKLELASWQPLMDENGDKRIRLDLLLILTGQNGLGLPEWLTPAYEKMDTEGSTIKEVPFTNKLEGMTFEAFSTDKGNYPIETEAHGLEISQEELGRRHVLLTGCTLRGFKLVRVSRNKQTLVCVEFSTTAKTDAAIALWAYKYHGGTFWGLFTMPEPAITNESPIKGRQNQMDLGEATVTEATPVMTLEEVELDLRRQIAANPEMVPNVPAHATAESYNQAMEAIETQGNCAFPGCILGPDHTSDHEVAGAIDPTPVTEDPVPARKRKKQHAAVQ
jgi:hypothetical protein